MRIAAVSPLFALGALLPSLAFAEAKLPEIELLSSGEGAKRVLRIEPKKGQTQTTVMSMRMKMAMSMGEMKLPAMDVPVTELTMKTTVTEVTKAKVRYEFVIGAVKLRGGAGLPPQQVELMRKSMAGIEGTKGWVELDRSGRTLGADFSAGPGVDPGARNMLDNMRQSMSQLNAQFPTAPVGVGAKWRQVFELDQMGFPLKQVVTYRLESLKGSGGVLAMTLEQTATTSQVTLPNLPPNTRAEIVEFTSKGSGTVDFDTTKIAPSRASTDLSTTMRTRIQAQGDSKMMGMDMQMSMTLEGR